ncbi:hypothetical protein KKG45_10150 [bacterium]|nr:hypothetical protein [bacterium]
MKLLTIAALIAAMATGAVAQHTRSFGWEDGYSTVFGTDGNVGGVANVTDVVHTGASALFGYEDPLGGTPQMYVAWISDLQNGDVVTASFWTYDTSAGVSPSSRIWGHYTDNDHLNYTGSAGGSGTYSAGTGWEQLTWTWTFDGTDPNHLGLMVEFRMYSVAVEDGYWCDDVIVTAPDHAGIWFPNQNPVVGENANWGGVKSLYK